MINEVTVRFAKREELDDVNRLRKMVNDVHVQGRSDVFRPGFCEELRQYLYEKFDSGKSRVIVAVADGIICGYTMADVVERPLSPYNNARSYCHIEEFGVDEAFRRRGIAHAMVDFCREEAKRMGLTKIELDMWEFNQGALAFYEREGFSTYRRYMELNI